MKTKYGIATMKKKFKRITGLHANVSLFGVLTMGLLAMVSCNNVPGSPGWEYMPDMYRSSSYETNSMNPVFADSLTNRKPVRGTISQGWVANSDFTVFKVPYPYKNDSAGYEDAGKYLKNPYPANDSIVAIGKERFEKYCIHCHGATGMGDGSVVKNGNFPPPPAYNGLLKNLPEGKMFHTLEYGKNLMGSHASQLTVQERWMIIRYVQTLQKLGAPEASASAPADTTNKTTITTSATVIKDTTVK